MKQKTKTMEPVGQPAPGANSSVSGAQTSAQAITNINREIEEKEAQRKADELKIPYIDVARFPLNPDILKIITPQQSTAAGAMPYFKSGKNYKFAVTDPNRPELLALLEELRARGYTIELSLASASSILDGHKWYDLSQYQEKQEVKNVVAETEIQFEKELENMVKIKDQLEKLPAEEALNLLNVSAIKAGASDVHYEPEETKCVLRFRIDGMLRPVLEISRDLYMRLANQLKYKAGMKLNVTSEPQDGRYRFVVNDRNIDVRVSSLPLEAGESFVCRVLDSGKKFKGLEELGFSGSALETIRKTADLAQGMVLVTGPTGSGKTTTLYVLLNMFNKPDEKIITLEDPIEYHLKGITQSQINEKRGYTFADGLRAVLRHDPDIVMIGEIRDRETAEVAVQAALTGHVLLATVHTNSAIETVTRLVTIGVSPLMIAPAVSVITAQRLVRRLCDSCVVDRPITDAERTEYSKLLAAIAEADAVAGKKAIEDFAKQTTVKAAKGCQNCNNIGYRGQLVISEVLHFDEDLREAVLDNKTPRELMAIARTKGFLTMAEDGLLKVLAGQTTYEEVSRVTLV